MLHSIHSAPASLGAPRPQAAVLCCKYKSCQISRTGTQGDERPEAWGVVNEINSVHYAGRSSTHRDVSSGDRVTGRHRSHTLRSRVRKTPILRPIYPFSFLHFFLKKFRFPIAISRAVSTELASLQRPTSGSTLMCWKRSRCRPIPCPSLEKRARYKNTVSKHRITLNLPRKRRH